MIYNQLQSSYNQLQDQLQWFASNYNQLQDWNNDLQWFACNYKTNTMIYNQLQDHLQGMYNDLQPITTQLQLQLQWSPANLGVITFNYN